MTTLKAIRSQHEADAALCKANGYVPSLSHQHCAYLLALLDEARKVIERVYYSRNGYPETVQSSLTKARDFLTKLDES